MTPVTIDPKAAAGAAGAAIAGILWTLLAVFVDAIRDLDKDTLAGLVGGTATVLSLALAYIVPNRASITPERLLEELPPEVLADLFAKLERHLEEAAAVEGPPATTFASVEREGTPTDHTIPQAGGTVEGPGEDAPPEVPGAERGIT